MSYEHRIEFRSPFEALQDGENVAVVGFKLNEGGLAMCTIRTCNTNGSLVDMIFEQQNEDSALVERVDPDGGPVDSRIFISARNLAKDEIRWRMKTRSTSDRRKVLLFVEVL